MITRGAGRVNCERVSAGVCDVRVSSRVEGQLGGSGQSRVRTSERARRGDVPARTRRIHRNGVGNGITYVNGAGGIDDDALSAPLNACIRTADGADWRYIPVAPGANMRMPGVPVELVARISPADLGEGSHTRTSVGRACCTRGRHRRSGAPNNALPYRRRYVRARRVPRVAEPGPQAIARAARRPHRST